jgi:hypothetical protein
VQGASWYSRELEGARTELIAAAVKLMCELKCKFRAAMIGSGGGW